jgi:hypothetical protein
MVVDFALEIDVDPEPEPPPPPPPVPEAAEVITGRAGEIRLSVPIVVVIIIE